MENKNIILDKSKSLALLIIKHCRNISEEKKEYVLSRQLMKSGTSIGANIREAKYAESKNDFIHKYKIIHIHGNNFDYPCKNNNPIHLEITLANQNLIYVDANKINYELPIDLDYPNDIKNKEIPIKFNQI